MDSLPVIAVIGATGAQGGGVIRAMYAEPERRFAARAITRKPDSQSARALAAEGVEVCLGNLDDATTLERAFTAVHAVYAVTNYWEHRCPERELAQAYNIATAARRAGVRHIVWSTLEDTRSQASLTDSRLPTLLGRYKVPQMDAKGESDSFFRDLPTTFLRTSFYWDNLIHFGMAPRPDGNGTWSLVLPMGDRKLPGIAASDIGACAFGIFKRGAELIGHTIGIAGEHLTGQEMAQALSDALGEPAHHVHLPWSQFAQLAFANSRELASMFQYMHDCNVGFRAPRSVETSRALHPGLMSFRRWLDKNAARIPRKPNEQLSSHNNLQRGG